MTPEELWGCDIFRRMLEVQLSRDLQLTCSIRRTLWSLLNGAPVYVGWISTEAIRSGAADLAPVRMIEYIQGIETKL
jgi:hypothetical protein